MLKLRSRVRGAMRTPWSRNSEPNPASGIRTPYSTLTVASGGSVRAAHAVREQCEVWPLNYESHNWPCNRYRAEHAHQCRKRRVPTRFGSIACGVETVSQPWSCRVGAQSTLQCDCSPARSVHAPQRHSHTEHTWQASPGGSRSHCDAAAAAAAAPFLVPRAPARYCTSDGLETLSRPVRT